MDWPAAIHILFDHLLWLFGACILFFHRRLLLDGLWLQADEFNGLPEQHYFGMEGFDCGFNFMPFEVGASRNWCGFRLLLPFLVLEIYVEIWIKGFFFEGCL